MKNKPIIRDSRAQNIPAYILTEKGEQKMGQFVDLHLHTSCSDGLCSPEEVLVMVREAKLEAFAITDHDTVEGYRAVQSIMKEGDPELISGVELSASYYEADLHILAYAFEPDYLPLRNALVRFQNVRRQRGRKMVEKLNDLGVNISYEDVQEKAGKAVIGRPHVAEAICASGAVRRYGEAFDKYIGVGRPAYIAKANFTPAEAMELIHESGGVAVLAHPAVNGADQHIEMLVGLGLDGLEVFHPEHLPEDISKYTKIAQSFGISITGGSDFHGRSGRNKKIGSQKVSYAYLSHLLARAKAYR